MSAEKLPTPLLSRALWATGWPRMSLSTRMRTGRAYRGSPTSTRQSITQPVNLMVHTNGVESFWSMLKRGFHSTHHHMSEKHLGCYIGEFEGRHNLRESDTSD